MSDDAERNAEDDTIDIIDALMAERLDEHGVPLDDYQTNRYDKCPLGQHDWHGKPWMGCPGAWASEEDTARMRNSKSVAAIDNTIGQGLLDGVLDGLLNSFEHLGGELYQPDSDPGTVIATLPAQFVGEGGALLVGTITVTAQSDGYSSYFTPTESDDSVPLTLPEAEVCVRQGFSTDLVIYDEA